MVGVVRGGVVIPMLELSRRRMNDEAMRDFAVLVESLFFRCRPFAATVGQAIPNVLSASAAAAPHGLDTAHGRRSSGVSAEKVKYTLLKSRLES